MAEIKPRTWKEEAKNNIIESAEILKRRAEDIVNDLDEEKVSEVYITIRIECFETPSLEIQKTYVPVNEKNYE